MSDPDLLCYAAGELAKAQHKCAAACPALEWIRQSQHKTRAQQDGDQRAQAETSLAAAAALGSAPEWKSWLIRYVRILAALDDTVRFLIGI